VLNKNNNKGGASMSSFSPHATFCAAIPEYEGIHMDAFFFVPTVVGLPAKPVSGSDREEFLAFSLLEFDTI
jgi:hypothetical protein